MRVQTEFVDLPRTGGVMRVMLARPADDLPRPALVFYSDIFQLTESTQRMILRFAGYGFVVAAPEIYWRYEAPGTAYVFDDAGRDRGQACAKRMSVRDFDDDIAALLAFVAARTGVIAEQIGAVGFCLGGHVGFRAALSPLVKATALFYPTGLHDGDLAGDGDAGSLARAGEIGGPLLTIFGRIDPHTDATGRETVQRGLDAAGIRHRISLYDAEHAFMRDVGARYDPSATDAAFAESIAWFREAGLTRVFLCAVDTLTEGEPKRIAVSGYEPLTVVGIAGRYFALSDECSHGMASLSDGWVEDGNLICSLHSGGFSLETGEATVPPCTDAIRRYDVVRDGDALFLAS